MSFRLVFAAIAFLCALPAEGQLLSFGGTASGFIYDVPSRSVRPVLGFPGSSYLGQPVLTDIDVAFIGPDGQFALVVEKGEVALVQGLTSGKLARHRVPTLSPPLDYVSWASNSRALVAYCSATRRISQLNVSMRSSTNTPTVDVSQLEGEVTGIATNNDATQTVIGIRGAVQGGFYGLHDGLISRLRTTSEPRAALFGNSGNSLYAIDGSTGHILFFPEGIYGSYQQLSLLGQPSKMVNPVGLVLSNDQQRLYVAGGADQMVREYDLLSHALMAQLDLNVPPQGLSPLAAAQSIFVLNPRTSSNQPMWLLDIRHGLSVFFVPPEAK